MTNFQSDSDKVRQVIHAELAWLEAHLRLDISALASLMADEYTQVNSRGELIGKQQVLASFQTGQRYWQQAESDEYQVCIYGDVAVVRGRWRAKGVNTGHPFDYAARYVSVWVYRGDRWQMSSDQTTELPGAQES